MQRSLRPAHLSKSWSSVWRQNVLQRDFTVNALVYDPFSQLLFDYAGGVADCAKQRLQCCVDPTTSFTHDPIRMLRAVRVCSRTGKAPLICFACVHAVTQFCSKAVLVTNYSRVWLVQRHEVTRYRCFW